MPYILKTYDMNAIIINTIVILSIIISSGEISESFTLPTAILTSPSSTRPRRSSCFVSISTGSTSASVSSSTGAASRLLMAVDADDEKSTSDFWKSQKMLAESMSEFANSDEDGGNSTGNSIAKLSEKEKYNEKVNSLVSETFYFSIIFFSATWLIAPNPFTPISYLLGASLGTAYCYGLGKYVETLGGSAYDVEDVKGSGVGSARFAFLIALFIFVGKFRSEGLQEIPAIMGFFTYQVSSLSQGLKESTD